MKLRTLILGLLSFGVLWVLGWEAWAIYDARAKTPAIFAKHRQQGGSTWNDLGAERQTILLAVEDPAFFAHRGIDMRTPGVGPTTITQDLAKWLYFEKFTPGFARIEQSLIALLVIDPAIPKEVQLDTFLALAPFTDGVTGFDAAARRHFGKRAAALDRPEFIRLVASLIGPDLYRPGSPANEGRAVRIAALLRGDCAPVSNRDVTYEVCAR